MPPRRSKGTGASVAKQLLSGSSSQDIVVKPWSNKLKTPDVSEWKANWGYNRAASTSGGRRSAESSKAAKSKRTRKPGRLAHLMEMPLEIFFEVASALHPMDLLSLSRVSKQFRDTFMSKKSLAIWKQALRNIPGLPECPPTLSEPQYVALVFERHCFGCGNTRAPKISYTLSVQFCGACYNDNVMRGRKLAKAYRDEHGLNLKDDNVRALFRVAFSVLSTDAYTGYAYDELRWRKDPKEHGESHFYYKHSFNSAVDRLRELMDNKTKYEKFVSEQHVFVVEMHKHGCALSLWRKESKLSEEKRLSNIRERRRASILAKLAELGYKENDYPSYCLEWSQLLDTTRELTPSNWTKLKPRLEKLIEECKVGIAHFKAQ